MAAPVLRPGKVYRTQELRRYGKNPTRLAARLVEAGRLIRLQKGFYHAPKQSVFGEVPPTEEELLRAYFGDQPYLRTGPSVWNALALGTTAVEAVPLVYNKKRSGLVRLGGHRFEFRRVKFPRRPRLEYFVVDILENRRRAGLEEKVARRALAAGVRSGRFDSGHLHDMALEFGTLATQRLVKQVVEDSKAVGI